MVSKRQKLAQKRFKEANPEVFLKSDPPPSKPNSTNKKKKKKISKKGKFKPQKTGDGNNERRKASSLRKHPLRVPGMKPGESCFICKALDHIAKSCPQKSMWEKHKICLLCRQRGHSVKNCPNKGDSNENGSKYCYNCGESGHSLSRCPQPLQDEGTKFANCFICNERGHLSKNCPKNAHGIYPKGGSCKICGGISHLAKDCPNKGHNNHSAVVGVENKHTSNEHGESWRGQKIIFASGDDLDDDFMLEDAKNGNQDVSNEETKPVSFGLESGQNIIVKPKKKQGPKVVNFLG